MKIKDCQLEIVILALILLLWIAWSGTMASNPILPWSQQGTPTLSLTLTPTVSLWATFDLDATKGQWDHALVYPQTGNVLVLMPEKAETPSPSKELQFDQITLIGIFDASGIALKPPYDGARTIRVGVPRGGTDDNTVKFASRLTAAKSIILLAGPAPTPTPPPPPTTQLQSQVNQTPTVDPFVTFTLDAAWVDWDRTLANQKNANKIVVVLVPERKSETPSPPGAELRFEDVSLIAVRDKNGVALTSPYTEAKTIHIGIKRDDKDATPTKFASGLTIAKRILLLYKP